MPLPIPLIESIEAAVNAWLRMDPDSASQLASIEGNIIGLHITGLDVRVFFLPGKNTLSVAGNYPEDGELDVMLHGSPLSLIRLGTSQSSGSTLLESDIEIEGDSRVAEQFSAILKRVEIDWEELLSRLVGDIVAHQAGQATKSAAEWVKESSVSMQMNLGEYLSEESRLTPAEAEITEYLDQVDNLRDGVERLEARIRRLQSA